MGKTINASILFFDVKGYSALDDLQLEVFHSHVLPDLNETIVRRHDASRLEDVYRYINTWGDGLCMIHDNSLELAIDALAMRDYFRNQNYLHVAKNFRYNSDPFDVRIALHFGTFYETVDSFRGNTISYYGRDIIHPARLEPVTLPGSVWSTKQFKEGVEHIKEGSGHKPQGILRFEPVGVMSFAKGHGEDEVWEVLRPDHDPPVGSSGGEAPSSGSSGDKGDAIPSAQTKAGASLDEQKSARIRTLIGVDPQHVNATHLCGGGSGQRDCSKSCDDANGDHCSIRYESLCMISELVRNVESSRETQQVRARLSVVANYLHELVKVWQEKATDPTRFWMLVRKIRYSIREMFDFIDDELPRNYDKPYNLPERFREFLMHRSGSFKSSKIDVFHENFMFVYKELSRRTDLRDKRGNNGPSVPELSSRALFSLDCLVDDIHLVINALDLVVEYRQEGTARCVKKVFKASLGSTPQLGLGQTYSDCIEQLPHNSSDRVPRIWPKD